MSDDYVTTRLFFTNGSSELATLPTSAVGRDRYLMPVITGVDDRVVHQRVVAFQRREFWFPPDFIGPLPSDDVVVEHDMAGRAAMERDLGADAVRRALGSSREGWRIVGWFVEVAP